MHLPIKSLTALAVAVQVAEHGSFAGASRALGLSTSAVSKAVGRLEQQLGIKLFNRTTRSVSLTSDGHMYVNRLRPLLNDVVQLTQDVVDHKAHPKGLLRVGAPVSFGHLVLAQVVAKFSKQYPDVIVEMVLDDRTLDLAKEQIDVSIRTGGLGNSANLVGRRFMQDPMIVCASPEYVAEKGEPGTIESLMNHRCITFVNNRTGRAEPWVFKGSKRMNLAGAIRSNTTDSIVQMILSGGGLAQISLYKAIKFIDKGQLVEVLKTQRPPAMDYSLLYLNQKLLAPRIRVFIDFLIDDLKASDTRHR